VFLCIFDIAAASEPPSQELLTWKSKYPRNALVSTAKNLDITVSVDGDGLEINQKYYREMMVLSDNSSSFADSKEYFNDHYTLNKFEAYTLVPEEKQYRKIQVPKYTKSSEIDDYVFYDDQLIYQYTFPAVGKGSKLVVKTDATTRYPYVPLFFDFGNSIPNENMSVTLSFPKNVKFNYHLFGKDTSIVTFSSEEKGDRIIYTWKADNPKVYDFDNLAPDSRYVIPHLIIQVSSYTVNKQEKTVLGSLKDLYSYNYQHISNLQKEPSAAIKSMADSLTAGIGTDREKVRNIFRWVQQHIKYVAIEDGDNGVVPSEADQVFKKRYGDCKGKTSLIVALLRSQGLKASFAWVGSRERPYKYSEFPSVVTDDHMIAVWWDNTEPVILDGTTFSHRMEDVPAFIQGKECLIEKGSEEYVLYPIPVAPAGNNMIMDSLCMELKGDSITGRGIVTFTGESRANAIREFEGKDTSQYKEVLQRLLTKASNKHMVKSVSISDIHNTDQPFRVTYTFILPDFITSANGNRYISLNVDRFLNQTVLKEDRQMPVESEMSLEYRMDCTLNIPKGYKIQRIPETAAFNNPLFGFNERYTASEEHVNLNSSVVLNFQVIDGDDMQQFRNMLLQLNRNYLKSLILEKI
jgi:hypothetical protein